MGTPLAKPARIGKYEIVSLIGRGGMGVVYRAMDPRIGRPVAIKVLTSAVGEEQELLERFYREARYTGGLQHQNIVTVYEFGEQDGSPFLVMEYLEGESLDDIITSRRPFSLAEKLGIIVQVCNGLSFANQRGVVHRDIKPANIVALKNGTVKIVDFGIAHVGGHRLTRTGQVVGSIHYMSPEQLSGNLEVDLRTDVYSTGVVLFQLLTGALPFQGSDTGSTLLKIVHEEPPHLSKFINLYPPELEAVIQKSLAKNRDHRYASAEEFAFDLEQLQQELNRELVAGYLQQASTAIERKEFTSAREQLLQVLRIDSQNTKANRLLREIQQSLEQHRRQQQVKQLLGQAEAAFGYKQLDAALDYVQQGLELDGNNTEFKKLEMAVKFAHDANARYEEAVNRAELALKKADLDQARKAIGEALEIDPNNPRGRTIAASIAKQIEERTRQQKAAQMQVVRATNSVEKALADARMHIFLDQAAEARDALEKVRRELAQVARDLQSQWKALHEEIQRKLNVPEPEHAFGTGWTQASGAGDDTTTSINLAPVGKSGAAPQPTRLFGSDPLDELVRSAPASEYSRNQPEDATEIPDELKEFLPPRPSRLRSAIWIAVAVLAFAVTSYYLVFWPKPGVPAHKAGPSESSGSSQPAASTEVTYAVINAEPWATVKDVLSANGDVVRSVNDQTPLRLELPPGQYKVVVEGPNSEEQELALEVPPEGGKSYFVFFRRPDIGRLTTKK